MLINEKHNKTDKQVVQIGFFEDALYEITASGQMKKLRTVPKTKNQKENCYGQEENCRKD